MKICICCCATAEDNAATCPKCGEASWTITSPLIVAPRQLDSVAADPEWTEQPKKQGKRR